MSEEKVSTCTCGSHKMAPIYHRLDCPDGPSADVFCVPQYDRDEVKRLEREIEITGDNRFVGMPLTAELSLGAAWPNEEYDDSRSMGNCMKHGDYDGRNISCPKCAVPQEDAPRECDCEECASRLATAPDWAMRVAEQIWDGDSEAQWQTPEDWIRNAAALIREAGSEREREIEELEDALSHMVTAMQAADYHGFYDCKKCVAAERLLGGESK